jgi:hypothetical protein
VLFNGGGAAYSAFPGDFDGDGDVDGDDLAIFTQYFRTGQPCTANLDCPADYFCQKEVGDCEGQGTCRSKGSGICPDVWQPICGCNGQTYGNSCQAAIGGVNVATFQPCPSP